MKKILAVLVTLSMIVVSSFASFANGYKLNIQNSEEGFLRFKDYISDLSDHGMSVSNGLTDSGEGVIYKFIDNEGHDITNSFISQISSMPLYKQYEFFTDNISCAIRRTESVTRAGDLSKTVEEDIYHNCTAKTIEGVGWDQIADSARTGRVYYRLRGSITYNPNTYKITSATPAIRVDIDWIDWDGDTRPFTQNEISSQPQIASDGYSATFEHYMQIFANHGADMDYALIGYGSFTDSFQISVR